MPDSIADQLPEDFEGRDGLTSIKDVESLAKSYVNLKRKMDTSINIPREGATPEDLAKVTPLMRPASPDSYEVPGDLPASLSERVNGLKQKLHEQNFSDAQFKTMARELSELGTSLTQQAQAQVEGVAQTWGAASQEEFGDRLGEVQAIAERYINDIAGGDEQVKEFMLNQTPLLKSPGFLKLMEAVHQSMGDDQMPSAITSGNGAMDVKEAKKRTLEIMEDPNFMKRNTPQGKQLAEELKDVSVVIEEAGFRDWTEVPD